MATMTSNLELLFDEVFATIKSVGDRLLTRIQRLEASSLESRVKALEDRPALVYRGVRKAGDALCTRR
jgi:hypothetical protein